MSEHDLELNHSVSVDTLHGVHENNPTVAPIVKEILISNSELSTEQKCDFRAYLQHGEEIQKIDPGEALNRGNFGHKCKETYWAARLQGLNHKDSKAEMYKFMVPETLRIQNPSVTNVYVQIEAALDWYNLNGYIPVETEQAHYSKIPGVFPSKYGLFSLTFCWTPDVVLEGTKAEHDKGDLIIADSKFTGRFWSDKKIRLYPQLHKYRYFWNHYEAGHVRRTLLMQMNTRQNKAASAPDIKPYFIPANKAKEERFVEENLELMLRFAEKKLQPLDQWKKTAARTIDSSACDYCPFSEDLCPELLEGLSVKTTLKALYTKNSYGYHVESQVT